MRSLILLPALLATLGCVGTPVPDAPEGPAPVSPATCGADRLQSFIGGPVEPAQQAAGQAITRVYADGDPVTLDQIPERVNFVTEGSGTLIRVTCG